MSLEAFTDCLILTGPTGSGKSGLANNVRRVIRALEVYELTGRPISAWDE